VISLLPVWCLPGFVLLALVHGHHLRQRLHRARNLPRDIAVHVREQIFIGDLGTCLLLPLFLLLGGALPSSSLLQIDLVLALKHSAAQAAGH